MPDPDRPHVLSRAAFERRLGDLTRTEFTYFVADLWEAKGADVTVKGDALRVSTPRGTSRRIVVGYRETGVPLGVRWSMALADLRGVDTLVTNVDADSLRAASADADVKFIGPDRLRRLALYGIDRDRCEAIFETYFDRPVAEKQSREVPADRIAWMTETIDPDLSEVGMVRRLTAPTGERILLSLCLVVLLMPVLIGAPSSPLHGATPFGLGHGSAATHTTASPTEAGAAYPSGLGPGGIRDRNALSAVHRRSLANTSYQLTLQHDQARALVPTTGRLQQTRQHVSVSDSNRIVYTVDGSLPPTTVGGDPEPFARRLVVNGTDCVTTRSSGPQDPVNLTEVCTHALTTRKTPFSWVTGAYIDRYLGESGSHVRRVESDNGTRYRVVATRPSRQIPIAVSNYTATALVDESGTVRRLSVNYETTGSERAAFSFRLTDVDPLRE